MKTKEELNALKKEVEALNRKFAELNEEELALVIGGTDVEFGTDGPCGEKEFYIYDNNVEKDFPSKYPTGSDK